MDPVCVSVMFPFETETSMLKSSSEQRFFFTIQRIITQLPLHLNQYNLSKKS